MEIIHLPPHLRKKINLQQLRGTKSWLRKAGLNTVCESARCPNISECFSRGTATFMLLGNRCTRNCGFCSVEKGSPQIDFYYEAESVAETVCKLGLRYVVLTSVTRDDLPDGGADHFRRTVSQIKLKVPGTLIEVLTPDFKGNESAWEVISDSPIDAFSHNIETVPGLYREIRPGADYKRSLKLLNFIHKKRGDVIIKSGLMLGLGETKEEVKDVMIDLKEAGCGIVTIGQYLRPSLKSLEVKRLVEEDEYEDYINFGKQIGLKYVFAGPFVRSSYLAESIFNEVMALSDNPQIHTN